MADGYGIGKLEDYIDSLRDGGVTFEIQNLSKEVQEIIRDLVKLIDQTVKGDVPTQKELKELQKGFYSYIQSSQTTTKETRNYVAQMFAQLFVRMDKLDKNRLAHSFNANLSNMVRSGVLDVDKKGTDKNVLAQLLKAGYITPVTKSIDSFQDKLMTFLNMEKSQEKTKKRQFVEDLVEGLSRSKFFGGAIIDFIRLGTFFIASWLKDKGTLGKVLAVALVAAGPVIGAAIAGAVSLAIVGGLFKLGGLLLKAVFTPVRWLGGKLFTWMGKLLGAFLTGKVFGRFLGAVGLGVKTKSVGTAVNAGMALAPGWGGNVTAFGGPLPQAAPKATNTGFIKTISGTVGKMAPWITRIGGIVGKILPWVFRLGKLLNIVGWIWLGIEAIVAIVKWWKGRKDKGNSKSSNSNIGVSEVASQNHDSTPAGQTPENIPSSAQNSLGSATLAGRQISSGYGMRYHPVTGEYKKHTGIDLKYKEGEAVNAFMGGTVISAQRQDGFGNTVRVQDENGYIHVYGHLNSIGVKPGQKVKRGQYLGGAGATGTATGVHLHYGVAKDTSWSANSYTDPIAYLGTYEPEALKAGKGQKAGKKKIDKFSQNVIDYWDSKGKDKGFLHVKALDYLTLATQYKEEYAKSKLKNKWSDQVAFSKMKESKEAKDYANRKIAEYVASKKAEAEVISYSNSIGVSNKTTENPDVIPVTTKNASQQAQEQWNNINRDFKKDKEERANQSDQPVVPPEKQPMIDFSGTETFSKVLQSAINIQQQTFQQR